MDEIMDVIIENDSMMYQINEKTKTASIKQSILLYEDDVFIPRAINLQSQEFIITSILRKAFYKSKVKSIRFASDSELQVIEEEAFQDSSIESLSIPSQLNIIGKKSFNNCEKLIKVEIPDDSKLQIIDENSFAHTPIESLKIPSKLEELREGWCINTRKLMKIEVSPNNPYFNMYENKLLIKKSFIDNPYYDQLVFGIRNLKKVIIPDFIETICTCAFEKCLNLESIEFPKNSKMRIIDDYAFYSTAIEKMIIPSTVTRFGKFAFCECEKLRYIEIPNDSNLQIIDIYAFTDSSIECLRIPSSVIKIKKESLYCCIKLQIIEFDENSKMKRINCENFYYNKHIIIMIPVNLINRIYY